MRLHIVQYGDSLASIAQRYETDIATICQLNGLVSYSLFIGQQLLVPFDVYHFSLPEYSNRHIDQESTKERGLVPDVFSAPPPSHIVQAGDTLAQIAARFNTSVSVLMQINSLRNTNLFIGQVLRLPTSATMDIDVPPSTNPTKNTPPRTYIVKIGDTLSTLAWIFEIPAETIKRLNKLTSDTLTPGTTLLLSEPLQSSSTNSNTQSVLYSVQGGDSLYRIAQKFGVSVNDLMDWNQLGNNPALSIGQQLVVGKKTNTNTNPPNPNPTPDTGQNTAQSVLYSVQGGDTLYRIAQKFGVLINDLIAWNQLGNNPTLSIGQQLIVGKKTNTNTKPPLSPNPVPQPVEPPINKPPSGALTTTDSPLSFSFTYNIKDSVGVGGHNKAADVAIIQNQLRRIGFLLSSDFAEENSASINPALPIATTAFPKTIAAIRAFQQVSIGTADGIIKPNGTTLVFLNTAVLPANQTQADQAAVARAADFSVAVISAKNILQAPLSAPVGRTNTGNIASDLAKVQQALVLLGFLDAGAMLAETATANTALSPERLPRTIAAIKHFQTNLVVFWVGRNPSVNRTFSEDLIGKDDTDLSFKILKEFARYSVAFAHPNKNERINTSPFSNYVKSNSTINLGGISYEGSVQPENLPVEEYEKIGLNRTQAKCLRIVSQHEGRFDAINSYDKATFSYGFIQFAGNGGGLAPMLAMLKYRYPNTFNQRFQRYGIDVEYGINNKGAISKGNITVVNNQGTLLRGSEAEIHIARSLTLTAVFIRAAHDINVQRAQIESAKRNYVTHALNLTADFALRTIKVLDSSKQKIERTLVGEKADAFSQGLEFVTLKSNGRIRESVLDFTDTPLTDIIRTEKGIAALMDIVINKWLDTTRQYFSEAIQKIASENHLDTLEKVCDIDEKQVLEYIGKIATGLIPKRMNSLLANTSLNLVK